MQVARYHMITELHLSSPPESVWDSIREVATWPSWWRWSRRMDELASPNADGIGDRYQNRIGTPLGYGFRYETEILEATRPDLMRVSSVGDLEGTGLFVLDRTPDGGTKLDFTWLVSTPKWWMNIMAPMAAPIFVWNHDKLMTDFARGLASASGGELLAVENRVLDHQDPMFFQLPTA